VTFFPPNRLTLHPWVTMPISQTEAMVIVTFDFYYTERKHGYVFMTKSGDSNSNKRTFIYIPEHLSVV